MLDFESASHFNPFALKKRVIHSKLVVFATLFPFYAQERIAPIAFRSVSTSYLDLSLTINERFGGKTEERIPNPAFFGGYRSLEVGVEVRKEVIG